MLPRLGGASLFLSLPDDVFSVITRPLCPKDVCSLGLTCRDLHAFVFSDKVWLAQCDRLGLVSHKTLIQWRDGVCSYKALCQFLMSIRSLLGIWVHQNPELGNVVYVMPGFLSVVGCRIIPQEVGPLGLEHGPILWSPVFEIICDHVGSTVFFLHGRERGFDYIYPGFLKSLDKTCNVLLLEVEPQLHRNSGKLTHSKSSINQTDHEISVSRILSKSDRGVSKSERITVQRGALTSFSRLGFGDRRRLLDTVTSQVRLNVPDTTSALLFPCSTNHGFDYENDMANLRKRRSSLLRMYKRSSNANDHHAIEYVEESPLHPMQLGLTQVRKSLNIVSDNHRALDCDSSTDGNKAKTISGILRNGLKQILGKSSSKKSSGYESLKKQKVSTYKSKHVQLHEFLQSGDTLQLTLRATTIKLSSYRAWPNMHDSKYALYKLPLKPPKETHEYAGLWGGTFGWPPGKISDEKPGKALFFIFISYEESGEQKLLIGTKILEGTSYVLHPNGSAMFIVDTCRQSTDKFPWEVDEESKFIDVEQSFVGEGIASGYGFRYPGCKPGSLYVIRNGLLVFVWKESRAALTLKRLELTDLLKRGERVPPLSPVSNFSYLTKTYSNVYSGFSESSMPLTRHDIDA